MKIKNIKKSKKKNIAASCLFIATIGLVLNLTNIYKLKAYFNDKEEYAELIDGYNEYVDNYIEGLDLTDYSDLDIFMKVMVDMWDYVDGFGSPEINSIIYPRLDVYNKVGVCRNMADDIKYKLNKINPKYNARCAIVLSQYDGECNHVDEVIKCVPSDNVVSDIEEKEELRLKDMNEFEKYKYSFSNSNHKVVLVDYKNVTLVLDPTNMLIGYIHDGKIDIINSDYEQFVYSLGDDILLSFPNENVCNIYSLLSSVNSGSNPEIEEEFGYEAQVKSYEKIK